MSKLRTSIEPYAFSLGIFGIILLVKISSYLAPFKLYFSFSSFLVDKSSSRFLSIIISLSIPLIIGILLSYLPYKWIETNPANLRVVYRYLTRQANITARAVGFFSSLFLAWPFIVYWDILVRPDIRHLRFGFSIAYFLYFVAYAYFCELGVKITILMLQNDISQRILVALGLKGRLGVIETVRTSLMGVIASGMATSFASILGTSVK